MFLWPVPTYTTVKSSKENNIYACEKHNHVIVLKYGKAADFKRNLQSSNIYKHLQTHNLINSKMHKEAGILCIDQLFSKKMLSYQKNNFVKALAFATS